jgi:tetratricopeptide (TPR) repeat protein
MFVKILNVYFLLKSNAKAALIFMYASVFAAGFLVYATTINYSLTYLDDKDFVVVCAPAYSSNSAIDAFKNNVLFSLNSTPYYRPVLSLSFMLDNKIAGSSVKFAHFSNIILHCLSACLLLFFLLSFTIKEYPSLAFLFALLFAIHPAAMHTAAWIPGRNDSLLLIWFICSLIFFIKYAKTKKAYWLLFHFFFTAAAFFTKESAVMLPFIMTAFFYCSPDRKQKHINVLIYLIWAAMICAFFYIRKLAIPSSGLSLSMLNLSKENVSMFFDFFDSMIFLKNSFAANSNIIIYASGTAAILLTAFAAFYKKLSKDKLPRAVFYFLLPFVFLSTNLLSSRIHSHGNRMYIPLFIAIVIFASFAAELIKNKKLQKKIICALLSAVILISGSTTLRQMQTFNGLNFFDSIINESQEPSNAIYKVRASYLIDLGYLREALNDAMFLGYLCNFNDEEVLYLLAYSMLLNENFQKAAQYCQKLITLNPNVTVNAYALLVIACHFLNDKEKKSVYFDKLSQRLNAPPSQTDKYLNDFLNFIKEKKNNEVNVIDNDKRSRLNIPVKYNL